MGIVQNTFRQPLSRRRFLAAGALGAAGLALYSGEVERHRLELTQVEVALRGLPEAFDGMRVAQMSDIHLDEFTEPYFLRQAIAKVNALEPDLVALTGDFVSEGPLGQKFAIGAGWQCAEMLKELKCERRFAVLGNHDHVVSAKDVTAALTANGIRVLHNEYLPIERDGARFWLAGVDDPLTGGPRPDRAIPEAIRKVKDEPVVLLCHGPDYVDMLLEHDSGRSVGLMLSGHTHGGQVRLPLLGALVLPPMGKKYVAGHFQFGDLQLYVNRGIGTVGWPLRLSCPPEITLFTLRHA